MAVKKAKRNKTIIKAKRVVIKRSCNPRKGKKAAGPIVKARTKAGRKRNAPRAIRTRKAAKPLRRVSSSSRKASTKRKVVSSRKAVAKRTAKTRTGKRNPTATEIRKEFAGAVNGSRDLYFPQGTPSGQLAKLGRLVLISTEKGTIKPIHGTAWLCADTRGKLHIGSTSPNPLFAGPAQSFGKVSKVEYESSKPHLGYKGPIIWFHKMGEETGTKPTLHADGKGGLVFRGGAYRLTRRGIEN